MAVLLLLAAFALGLLAKAIGLPPLVGFLTAGFLLHGFGLESTPEIEAVADAGVLLLLFGIGLKLQLRTLAQPMVWVTATSFAAITTAAMTGLLLVIGTLGLPLVSDLDLTGAVVIAFAFSFCSTVFAVKTLEEANESASLSGRIAIGVLVLQDVLAVAFLVVAGGDLPSPWALLAVPALLATKPALGWLLDRVGHGEMLVLFGVLAALVFGAELFALVDLKPDLGALVVGVMLSNHRRAPELSSRLLDIKDLLLVGFFLSIGLAGIPSAAAWGVGGLVLILLPLRTLLLLGILTRLRLRARTSFNAAAGLSTYSEFGLIVAAAGVSEGLIGERWLAAVAVSVGLSFVIAALLRRRRYEVYLSMSDRLARLVRHPTIEDDSIIDISDATILVFGMGRVGSGAYDELVIRRGRCVLGIDHSLAKVRKNLSAGREVIRGDALDRDFWERVVLHDGIELVVASMGRHAANLECVRRVREFLPDVPIASIAQYPDELEQLHKAGVTVARNLFEEAGQALADDTVAVVFEE